MEICREILEQVSEVRIIGVGEVRERYCAATGTEMLNVCDDDGKFKIWNARGMVTLVELGEELISLNEFRETVSRYASKEEESNQEKS